MRILAIESSCDETGAAVIEDGRVIRSNVVASQASIHERYGGVVPEVASRQQLSALIPVVETALREASASWDDIDAIAATYGPGLAGSLLVGLTGGKALALARGLPFIGVNHLEAHIYANWLRTPGRSGPLSDARQPGRGRMARRSAFPAAGAGDLRRAQRAGLDSPATGATSCWGRRATTPRARRSTRWRGCWGSAIPVARRSSARRASATRRGKNPYTLPRAWLPGTYDFSFSGLKTAVLQLVEGAAGGARPRPGAEPLCARGRGGSAGRLASRFPIWPRRFRMRWWTCWRRRRCARRSELGVRQVLLAGGVAANLALRARLDDDSPRSASPCAIRPSRSAPITPR